MKPAFEEIILTVSSSMALSTLAKATLAVALGLFATFVERKKRAALRHTLLAETFGVLLLLPIVSAVVPPVRIAMRVIPAHNAQEPGARARDAASPIANRMPSGPPVTQSNRWTLSDLLVVCWVAGTVLFLVPAGVGLRQVGLMRRSGLPWRNGQSLLDQMAHDAGIRRPVGVLLHEQLAGPMTCGARRPAIVLPADAQEWDRDDLNRAMVHELEHVMRRDWLMHCLARMVCAVYWFHPLVWMAWRRLELEAERACDDAVLARSEATAYADQLVAVARRLSAAVKPPLPAMVGRADLPARVSAVLDSRQRRGRAGALCVTLASLMAAMLVVAVSPLRVVAAPAPQGTESRGRFRSDTMLVMTRVTVTYSNGNTVEGLTASDFIVMEDGVQQAISVFEFQKAAGVEPPASYYILGYYPRSAREDGEFRKIGITVKTATVATLKYRDGYYAMRHVVGPGSVVSVGPVPSDIRPPVVVHKKDAEYSEAARKANYQGTVLLDVQIDTVGTVTSARVVRSLGLGLDEQAIEAVQQWRFRPATKDGKAVDVQTQVEVNFRLL